ncbi:unnamed protein product [Prunus armeniaca]
MQTAMLPASDCSKLDQLNKNFLWGHAFDKAKAAWMNQALLAKSGWRLLQNDQGLWAKEMLQLNVSDFLDEGLWDISCLQECLPPDIVLMITSIHAGFIDSGPDICLPRLRPSFGCFVTKNSVLMLKGTVEFGSWFEESSVLYPNFDDWLFHNLHSKRSFMTGLAWNLAFAQVILQYVKDWLTATKPISIPLHQGVVYLHWQAPLPGRCKVNSDGSCKHALGYIGAGAGFRSVEVECDSKSVMGLLLNPPSHTHPLFSIINCCYLLIQKEWCCSVKYIFREQNFVTDSLASMSHDLPLGLHILDSAPGVVIDLLVADARSLARPRMIVV